METSVPGFPFSFETASSRAKSTAFVPSILVMMSPERIPAL